MDATSLYIRAARFVIGSNINDAEIWSELCQYLPVLRQALSCCVCQQVLHTPMGPTESTCQHHVCRQCIGGKMKLKPQCSWCKDFDAFVENPPLQIIVLCFRKLCEYLTTSVVPNLLSAATSNGGTQINNLLSIIQDGMAVRDDYLDTALDKTVNDAVPPKLHKENGIAPLSPTSPTDQHTDTADGMTPLSPTETVEDVEGNVSIEEVVLNGSTSPDVHEPSTSTPPTPPPPDVQPQAVSCPLRITVPRVRRRDRSRKRRRAGIHIRRRSNIQLPKMNETMETPNHPVTSADHNRDCIHKSDKSKHTLNNTSPSTHRHAETYLAAEDTDESQEHSDIPILKISETVSIEHDYNRGLPSENDNEDDEEDEEDEHTANQLTSAPQLIPVAQDADMVEEGDEEEDEDEEVPSSPTAAAKRIKLERPPIHHDRTMVQKSHKSKKTPKTPKPKSGCRCGMATAKPGNLTCCGQRCPCYSSFKGCVDCRCRGCRNPRGDPAKNPLALQLQQMQQQQQQQAVVEADLQPFPPLLLPPSMSEESDIEIDI